MGARGGEGKGEKGGQEGVRDEGEKKGQEGARGDTSVNGGGSGLTTDLLSNRSMSQGNSPVSMYAMALSIAA